MGRFYLLCAFFIVAHAYAQTPTQEQLAGTWIGVHTEWNPAVFCPLPIYMQLETDGTYRFGMLDHSARAISSTWAVDSAQVRLDTIHFAPKQMALENGLLRIGTNYPMVFRRFTDIPLDSATAYQQLSGRIWQSDSMTVYLYANGQVMLEHQVSKRRTAHFWTLAKFGTSVFLVVHGNQYRSEGNYNVVWQLSSLSPKHIQAIGSKGNSITIETFRLLRNLTPGDSCRPSGFQPCSNCFEQTASAIGLGRSHRRYDLNQLLTKHYKPVQTSQSGLIRIQFVINCEGAQGMYQLSSFDTDYCPKTFDVQITDQLAAICRDYLTSDQLYRLNDRAPDAESNDVAVSFTVRLQNGSITDILP